MAPKSTAPPDARRPAAQSPSTPSPSAPVDPRRWFPAAMKHASQQRGAAPSPSPGPSSPSVTRPQARPAAPTSSPSSPSQAPSPRRGNPAATPAVSKATGILTTPVSETRSVVDTPRPRLRPPEPTLEELKAIRAANAEREAARAAARAAAPPSAPADPSDVVGTVRDALPEMVRKLVAIASGDSKQAGTFVQAKDILAASKQLEALAERLGVLPSAAPSSDEASADGTPAGPVVPGRVSMSRQITAVRKPPVRSSSAPSLRVVGGEES